MQKILLMLIVFLSASTGFAQINKGQFLAGGSGSFSNKDVDGIKSNNFTLTPNAGYFFMNKLAGGISLSFGNTRTKMSDERITLNGYGVSPFVRYYVLPTANKVNLFAQASYGWGKSVSSSTYNNSKYKTNFNSFSFSAGPTFFVNRNVAIELTAGYNQTHSKSKYDGSTFNSKNKNFQVGVGFQIHLGGGKEND